MLLWLFVAQQAKSGFGVREGVIDVLPATTHQQADGAWIADGCSSKCYTGRYGDLSSLVTEDKARAHYEVTIVHYVFLLLLTFVMYRKNSGKAETRECRCIAENFWEFDGCSYKCYWKYNGDLKHLSEAKTRAHYETYGKKEGRPCACAKRSIEPINDGTWILDRYLAQRTAQHKQKVTKPPGLNRPCGEAQKGGPTLAWSEVAAEVDAVVNADAARAIFPDIVVQFEMPPWYASLIMYASLFPPFTFCGCLSGICLDRGGLGCSCSL
jgi:hypothetical protein